MQMCKMSTTADGRRTYAMIVMDYSVCNEDCGILCKCDCFLERLTVCKCA